MKNICRIKMERKITSQDFIFILYGSHCEQIGQSNIIIKRLAIGFLSMPLTIYRRHSVPRI